jgi:hypothetical protein
LYRFDFRYKSPSGTGTKASFSTSGRYFLAGASALYFSLISYFFSYMTNYMSSLKKEDKLWALVNLSILMLWALGIARMLLRFFAFRHANDSFGVGRNARLIEGYMA